MALIPDPVTGCQLYKDLGCSHVDGFLCDYPNCSMNNEHILQNNCHHPHQIKKIRFGCEIIKCEDCRKNLNIKRIK